MTSDPESDPGAPTPAPETVQVVNDRRVDATTTPIMLYPNSRRQGQPVAVLLVGTGQTVTVVPAGEAWRTIPGGASSLAQRLWITRAAVGRDPS